MVHMTSIWRAIGNFYCAYIQGGWNILKLIQSFIYDVEVVRNRLEENASIYGEVHFS